jgi:hypothetical protein
LKRRIIRMEEERKPKTLNQIWTESALCEHLGLPEVEDGKRSRQISNWIKGGLRYVERSDRRYFFEQDVIDYLWNRSVAL